MTILIALRQKGLLKQRDKKKTDLYDYIENQNVLLPINNKKV